jgi:hypothetical protein
MISESPHDLRTPDRGKRVRRVAQLTITCLVVCLVASGQVVGIGRADGGTTVSIDPPSRNGVVGVTTTTDVRVEDVTDLYGFEFQITFDQTVVEGVDIEPGGFLSPDWILEKTVDNGSGIIAYAMSQMSPSEPQSGEGALATITWRGKAEGTSPIQFTYVLLGAPGGIPIAATTQDGEIVVGEAPSEFIFLPMIIGH